MPRRDYKYADGGKALNKKTKKDKGKKGRLHPKPERSGNR